MTDTKVKPAIERIHEEAHSYLYQVTVQGDTGEITPRRKAALALRDYCRENGLGPIALVKATQGKETVSRFVYEVRKS